MRRFVQVQRGRAVPQHGSVVYEGPPASRAVEENRYVSRKSGQGRAGHERRTAELPFRQRGEAFMELLLLRLQGRPGHSSDEENAEALRWARREQLRNDLEIGQRCLVKKNGLVLELAWRRMREGLYALSTTSVPRRSMMRAGGSVAMLCFRNT